MDLSSQSTPDAPYGAAFYDITREGSRRSAGVIVPELVALLKPRSVVDVGCGEGLWLAAFRAQGVEDAVGVDGAWVRTELLAIPHASFQTRDLTRPLGLSRTFDVALSLEVAEHLPAEAAGLFIGELCGLAPVVVFSAAAPMQGGEGHVNEQWPSYWTALFAERGFVPAGDFRARFWTNADVEFWYRQNLFCFVDKNRRDLIETLERAAPPATLDAAHPQPYLRFAREWAHERERVAWFADQHTKLTADVAAAAAALAQEQERHQAAVARLGDERRKLDAAEAALGHSERALTETRGALHAARAQADAVQERLHAIESSRSWRFVLALEPLLAAVRRVERLVRGK